MLPSCGVCGGGGFEWIVRVMERNVIVSVWTLASASALASVSVYRPRGVRIFLSPSAGPVTQ